MICITKTDCTFEREPLKAPFGFKGGYIDELWQTVALLQDREGNRALGLGTQSVLWSDEYIFKSFSQAGGNSVMFLMTEYALKKAGESPFDTPMALLDRLLPEVYEYGKRISGNSGLRVTFALNALVAVDNAAWLLYARHHGIADFDAMIPATAREALSHRHEKLAGIPLVTYGVGRQGMEELLAQGCFFFKIKIGSDPEKDGDLDKMLAWDKNRLSEIHSLMGDRTTPHTESGRILYYLDANGRYDGRDRLMRLLDHAGRIGALDRIILLEEPFPEGSGIDVRDIPARMAADESAHTEADTRELIDLGYRAIALKPIAKTMSMSLKIAKAAHDKGIPCFCADLTVNPVLVDWNKNVAARLAPLPGMKMGVLESNGHQNYAQWDRMKAYHPCCGSRWTTPEAGVFTLNEDFYSCSGGIFEDSDHYMSLMVK